MRSQVGVRPEQQDSRPSRFRCVRAPPDERLRPLRATVAPINQEEPHVVRRREVGWVVQAQDLNTGERGGLDDPRGDDEVPPEKDDPHSAGVDSDAAGVMGPDGTSGRGVGAGTPFPFDPLSGMPSIT